MVYLAITSGSPQSLHPSYIRTWAGAQHFLQDCMYAQPRHRRVSTPAQYDQFSQGDLLVAKDPKRLQADSEGWSDCADAQASMSLRWAHMQSCRKCCDKAYIFCVSRKENSSTDECRLITLGRFLPRGGGGVCVVVVGGGGGGAGKGRFLSGECATDSLVKQERQNGDNLRRYMSNEHLIHNIRKHTCGHVYPWMIHINMHIREVWSESSLGTFWIAKVAKFLCTDAQADLSLRWAHISEGTFSLVET